MLFLSWTRGATRFQTLPSCCGGIACRSQTSAAATAIGVVAVGIVATNTGFASTARFVDGQLQALLARFHHVFGGVELLCWLGTSTALHLTAANVRRRVLQRRRHWRSRKRWRCCCCCWRDWHRWRRRTNLTKEFRIIESVCVDKLHAESVKMKKQL